MQKPMEILGLLYTDYQFLVYNDKENFSFLGQSCLKFIRGMSTKNPFSADFDNLVSRTPPIRLSYALILHAQCSFTGDKIALKSIQSIKPYGRYGQKIHFCAHFSQFFAIVAKAPTF